MTKPLNSVVPANSETTFTYDPGVPVYVVLLRNQNAKQVLASASYDRASGTLVITILDSGV